jgi:energy-converting hydrogenase A subunit P
LSLISYKSDSCIRNGYYHNTCSSCIETCQEDVFSIFQNRIKFESEKCNYCLACLGTCPSEAIKVDTFDQNREALLFKYSNEDLLTCQNRTKCLSAFDSEHFSIMALQRDNLEVDLSLCKECHLSNLENSIVERVKKTNTLLADLKVEKEIKLNFEIIEKEVENSKRGLFNKLLGKAEEKLSIDEVELEKIDSLTQKLQSDRKMYPLKHKILLGILKDDTLESLESFQSNTDILSSQKIDSSKCTNCGDCSQFCPTGSLFATTDKLSIYIYADRCISCSICHDICKVDAIHSEKELESIEMFKPKKLVSFEMATCVECKIPFIKRDDSKICDRCIDFTTNFSHMFALARDV